MEGTIEKKNDLHHTLLSLWWPSMTATILTDVIFTLPLVSCSHAAHTLRTTAPAPIINRPRTDHRKHGPHTQKVSKEIKQLF